MLIIYDSRFVITILFTILESQFTLVEALQYCPLISTVYIYQVNVFCPIDHISNAFSANMIESQFTLVEALQYCPLISTVYIYQVNVFCPIVHISNAFSANMIGPLKWSFSKLLLFVKISFYSKYAQIFNKNSNNPYFNFAFNQFWHLCFKRLNNYSYLVTFICFSQTWSAGINGSIE